MRSWNYYSSLYPNILCNIFGIFWRDFYKTTNICLKAERTAAHPSTNNPVTLAWPVSSNKYKPDFAAAPHWLDLSPNNK